MVDDHARRLLLAQRDDVAGDRGVRPFNFQFVEFNAHLHLLGFGDARSIAVLGDGYGWFYDGLCDRSFH